MNVPVLITNLGLLEQLSYWKVSAPCSAAGYSLTMKKHGYAPPTLGRLHRVHVCAGIAEISLFQVKVLLLQRTAEGGERSE